MSDMISPLESGGHLIIDLSSVVANWKKLAAKASNAECAAVVKADAYGTKIEIICPALAKAGCKTFFVAHLSEAKLLRAILPDVTIYVLNGLFPQTVEIYQQINAHPVLGSIPECMEWASFPGNNIGAALHIDTGLNRFGLSCSEFESWLSDLKGVIPFKVILLMSHLACASKPKHPHNAKQISAFNAIRQKLPMIKASLANSSGIFLSSDIHYELVRPGYALYGGNPTPGQPNPMLPVVTLLGRIVELRDALPGEFIGYDNAFAVKNAMRIAVVSIGYADGLLRSCGGDKYHKPAEVVIAGHRCSLVGNISMDMILIDVTHIPQNSINRGDFVEILGSNIGVDELAGHAGTIGYEILTSIGGRYTRQLNLSPKSMTIAYQKY